MDWLFDLYQSNPTAQAIAIISLVCVAGMSLGSIAVRGIKLGTSGVLFAAILCGHFSKPIDHHTLEFVKEFGLILFVFCMGLQLGPGFFASLRRAGARFNALATMSVVLGTLSAVVVGWLLKIDRAAVLGILSGATTNTPSLGAAQQTLSSFPSVSAEQAALPAMAYAVTYPMGIVGIIATLLMLKTLFRADIASELQAHAAAGPANNAPLQQRTVVVENANLEAVAIQDVPALAESGVVVSRVRHADAAEVIATTRHMSLRVGDRLLVVGSPDGLDRFQRVVGRYSEENLLSAPGTVSTRRIVVTNKAIVAQTVGQLDLETLYGAVATRVARGEIEMTALPSLRMQFGDVLQVVGPEEAVERAAAHLGNSLQALNETQFVPMFAGIAAGIALGTLPIPCPGLPQPLRLGLAAGPLIVAIVVGRIGRIGRLVWHMPRNSNLAFREFGIALFFASVGLMAGPTFFAAAFSSAGLLWLAAGTCVTVLPLLAVGILGRTVFGLNYVDLMGLLAGSTTDPPALAFASNLCQSEAPAVAYATVYPLTMLLRIISAQVLAVLFFG
jgi:putative transport protein